MNAILDDWYLYYLLNFFNTFLNHNFRNNTFHNLRYFNNFFNHTWYNYNFLNYLLYFYYFRYFNHLFNDFLHWYFYLFNAIYMSNYLNNLFLNVFDWFWYLNVVIYDLLDLDGLGLADNNRITDLDDDRNLALNGLDDWLFNNFSNLDESLMNDWYLNNALNLFGYFPNHLHHSINDLLYFLNDFSWHDLLHNHLYFIGFFDNSGHLNYLLDHLGHFNDAFFSLDNDHWLFNDAINYLIANFNVILSFFSCNYVDLLDYLFYNSLDFNNLRYTDNFFYYFLHYHWHLYNLFYNFLNWHKFLSNYLNFTYFN